MKTTVIIIPLTYINYYVKRTKIVLIKIEAIIQQISL